LDERTVERLDLLEKSAWSNMATRGYDTSQLFLRAVFEEKEEKEKEG
jgi:hypothetical protein